MKVWPGLEWAVAGGGGWRRVAVGRCASDEKGESGRSKVRDGRSVFCFYLCPFISCFFLFACVCIFQFFVHLYYLSHQCWCFFIFFVFWLEPVPISQAVREPRITKRGRGSGGGSPGPAYPVTGPYEGPSGYGYAPYRCDPCAAGAPPGRRERVGPVCQGNGAASLCEPGPWQQHRRGAEPDQSPPNPNAVTSGLG